MKISHLDNNSFKIKMIIAFLVLFTTVHYFFGSYYKPFIHRVFESILIGVYPKYYTYLSELEKENSELKNQIENMHIVLKDASITEDFLQQGMTELIDANSVFGTHTFLYDTLLLDKGSASGVRDNALVFGAGLLPVGYIQKSYINSAECILLTAYKIETKAVVSVINTEKLSITKNINSTTTSTNNATSTSDIQLQQLTQKTAKQKDMNVTLIGDGAYGYYAILPESIQIATGTKLYLESNPNYALGEVVSQIKNENEKVQKIIVRSNFSPTSHTHFYIEK